MIAMNMIDEPSKEVGRHIDSEVAERVREQPSGSGWVVGLALVGAGLWALLRMVMRMPLMSSLPIPALSWGSHAWDLVFLPALGCILLAWGTAVRKTGLLIPGGVLAGVGLGVMVAQGPFGLATPDAQAGIILASIGLGWVAVAVLNVSMVNRRAWWPFIPAAVLGALGLTLVIAGGAGLAALVGVGVPAALIAVGVALAVRRRR